LTQIAKILLITLIYFAAAACAYPQNYKNKITKDSISISYTWQKEKRLNKNSPYILLLQVKNQRNTKVVVSFVVLYYWKAQLHSTSDTKKYCLKPGQVIKGKRWNLAFKSDFIVLDEYLDPMFNWEISRLTVEENKDCKTGLRLKLQPAYSQKIIKNMLQIDKMKDSNVIGLAAKHVVTREDFHKLDSIVEHKSEHFGKIRMLIHVGNLNGVLLSAFWEDLKMSVNHPYDFEKVAFISPNKIEKIIRKTTSPLVNSQIQVFREPQRAKQWILDT
jgi:hypothetical protein